MDRRDYYVGKLGRKIGNTREERRVAMIMAVAVAVAVVTGRVFCFKVGVAADRWVAVLLCRNEDHEPCAMRPILLATRAKRGHR